MEVILNIINIPQVIFSINENVIKMNTDWMILLDGISEVFKMYLWK